MDENTNAEKAEQKRLEEESLRGQRQALESIEAGGPDFWSDCTDRVVVNARALKSNLASVWTLKSPP